MRSVMIVIVVACAAGCATQRRTQIPASPVAANPIVREASPTRLVETRYDIRSYRDANDPGVRHEPHAVYRATRVPTRAESLETTPRTAFAPVSYTPLPQSAELSAELEAQRQITAELREIKTRMAAIETQAQSQYGNLVNQTAESLKLRQQLLSERARVAELEAKLRENKPTPAAPSPTVAATEPKW